MGWYTRSYQIPARFGPSRGFSDMITPSGRPVRNIPVDLWLKSFPDTPKTFSIYLLVTICWSIFFLFKCNFNLDCMSRLLVPIRSITTEQFSIFSSRRISESVFSDPSSLSSWTFVRPGCGFRYKTRSSNENALEWWTNCQYLFVSHGVVRVTLSFTTTGFYWDTEK